MMEKEQGAQPALPFWWWLPGESSASKAAGMVVEGMAAGTAPEPLGEEGTFSLG